MFRKRKPAKQLSAEELKSKLYAHFDKSGSLNQMRTEIRSKLASELLKVSPAAPDIKQFSKDFNKTLLPLQVCNWLVYDHLLRQGYQYALSTFVTEANVPQPERLLTACDILSLFRLDSSTPEYKSISKMYSANNKEGLLHSLLLAVIKSLFDFPNEESINQSKDTGVSIKETTASGLLFEKIDSSETPRFNQELFTGQVKKSVDSGFPELLQLLKEEKEKEILALRQKWLEELDRLHFKERAMKEDIESKRKEIQRELSEILSEKKKLQEKEFLLVKEHENELAKRIRELETDYMSKIHSKENELKISQGKLYDKELKVAQVEGDFISLKNDYHSLKRELEEIQQTYKLTKEKYSVLLDENTKLLKKFESMSDYSILKGDLEARLKEISSLHQHLDETKETAEKEKTSLLEKIRSLETKLKYKDSQLAEVQRQLSLCRDTMHREESIWNKERKKLEHDSQESKEMYKTLILRLEEQREDIQALHHTIHILHFQLTDTDKIIQAKPNTFVPQGTKNKFQDMNIEEPGIFRLSNSNSKSLPKYSDDSLKFIEEAKNRIKNLEKEAHTLRDKCSAVFCHVPALKDTHNSTTNPLRFNFANVPVLPINSLQSCNNRFETLIQNEMPILDSCLQTHAKRQYTNIATGLDFPNTTDSKIYSGTFKDTGLERSKTIAFSDLSSLNLYNQHFAPTYASNREVGAPDRSKVKSTVSKEFRENQSLHQPTDGITNYTSTENEQTLGTTETPTTVQRKLSIPLTGNVSFKPKETDTIANYDLTTEDPSLSSFTPDRQAQSDVSPTKNAVQPHFHDFNEGDKINSVKDSSGKEESSLNNDSALEPVSPIVVDLDSAWKRKTSLKDNFESQSVPSILSGLESAWKRKTSLMVTSSNSLLNSNLSAQNEEKQDIAKATGLEREQILDENKDGFEHINSDAEIVQIDRKNQTEHVKDSTLESKSQVPSVYKTELESIEPKMSSENVEDIKENANMIIEKKTLQESKEIPDDSISELSDIHLSCGSEQEQQKEDSDNW